MREWKESEPFSLEIQENRNVLLFFFFFTGFNIDYIKNVNMNIPQSPEARLVQVSLLPVWVETQLRPPRLPIASHPVLRFQNLTGNPERQYYDVKKVSFY